MDAAFAGSGRKDLADDFEQRRFSAARCAHQRARFAFRNAEVNVVQRGSRPALPRVIHFGNALQLYGIHGLSPPFRILAGAAAAF